MPSGSPNAPRSKVSSARPGGAPTIITSTTTAASPALRAAAGISRAIKRRRQARNRRRIAPGLGSDGAIARFDRRRPLAFDDAPPGEIDQMRMYRSPCGAAQPRLKPDIEPVHDRVDMPDAG